MIGRIELTFDRMRLRMVPALICAASLWLTAGCATRVGVADGILSPMVPNLGLASADTSACLEALQKAYSQLGAPHDSGATVRAEADYNGNLHHLLSVWPRTSAGEFVSWKVPKKGRSFALAVDWLHSDFPPSYFDRWYLADAWRVVGLLPWKYPSGVGVPLVGWRLNRRTLPEEEYFPPEGISRAVTAVLIFTPEAGRLVFLDPLRRSGVAVNSMRLDLATDLTTPYAYLVQHTSLQSEGVRALTHPEAFRRSNRLVLMQPYDPSRIPVLFVHGLRSSPLAWRDVTNVIWTDPVLRRRYQVWHYFYPTGLPYLHAADQLRSDLDDARRFFGGATPPPALNEMVLIGHSMGGLIVHALASDSGMALWNAAFTEPPEKVMALRGVEPRLRDIFIFRHESYVGRVVFIATPHRGTGWADFLLGRMLSNFVELPETVSDFWTSVGRLNPDPVAPLLKALGAEHHLSSIRMLSPRNPVLRKLAELPVAAGIPYHTIIGQKDFFVPYASAHLAGADSEITVPAGHSAYDTPEAVAEIARILHKHLASLDRPP